MRWRSNKKLHRGLLVLMRIERDLLGWSSRTFWTAVWDMVTRLGLRGDDFWKARYRRREGATSAKQRRAARREMPF